jgi:hypothetical protein
MNSEIVQNTTHPGGSVVRVCYRDARLEETEFWRGVQTEPRTQRSGVSGVAPLTPLRCVRGSDAIRESKNERWSYGRVGRGQWAAIRS